MEAVIELARDEDLCAIQPGLSDTLADSLLVSVHLGGIDVAIPDLEGSPHRRGCFVGLNLEHTEAKLWDAWFRRSAR